MHVRIFYVQASLPHLAPPLSMYTGHSESSLSFQTSTAQWTRARLVAPGWWYTHQCTSTHNHYHFCSVLCSNHYACVHTLQCVCVSGLLVQVGGVAYRGRIMVEVQMTLGSSPAVPREPLGPLDKENSMVNLLGSWLSAIEWPARLWQATHTVLLL